MPAAADTFLMKTSKTPSLAASQSKLTPERLVKMSWGYAPLLVIQVALSEGLFDLLNVSPATVQTLAKKTGASMRGLRAVLNALVGLGLLKKTRDLYRLTAESAAYLVPGKPTFYGGLFDHHVRQVLPRWLQLRRAFRSGRGVEVRGRRETQAHFAEFVEALFVGNYGPARRVGEHLGVARAKQPLSVLDLGAGSGVWGIALAEQSPKVSITAVDWPLVLKVTRRVAKTHGVAERLKTIAGDLLEVAFPPGHQIVTIGHVLHSEGAARSRKLLKKAFAALAPGGTVVIGEFIPNEDRTGPAHPLLFAVNMLVHNDTGDTFTVSEISSWLREAGFRKIRQFDAQAASPLILATKPL